MLELRDAFVAAGRALFDALDVFAAAAGEGPYDRVALTVYPSTGGVSDPCGDILGYGDAPTLTVGYDAFPYDAWETPGDLAAEVARRKDAAEAWAATCREASQRAVVESARRTLEAAGWAVELPDTAGDADRLGVQRALADWTAAMAAEGRKVAVDATLCPVLWDVACRALASSDPWWRPRTPTAVVLAFPDGRLVVYDGGEYTVYADTWARAMGHGQSTGRRLGF